MTGIWSLKFYARLTMRFKQSSGVWLKDDAMGKLE